MPTKELKPSFIFINGVKCEPTIDITESVETSNLDEIIECNFDKNKEFEITFEADKESVNKIHALLQPKNGDKITVEKSCVCDGTSVFAIQLMRDLQSIGAVNIKVKCEEVENPNPEWMKTRFVATGIIRNTNNFRKLHGIPMKRKIK